MRHRCEYCGRFVANVTACYDFNDAITQVFAECSKHGVIEVHDWDYDDFGPPHFDDQPQDNCNF